MATVFLGGARVLFIVMAPMARRSQMVLDVVVETEIAVLGVYEIDRMTMYLMRLIGIDETVLIECDQCNKGPAEKACNKKVCGGHGIEDRDDEQNRIPDGESSDDFANLALLALFYEVFDQETAGHQVDALPERVATEIKEARTVVRKCSLGVERSVIFHVVHVDVLHAVEARDTRRQQRKNIFEIELQCLEDRLDARAGSRLGREYASVDVLMLDNLLRELAQQQSSRIGHDYKIIDRAGQDEEQRHWRHKKRVRHPDACKDRIDRVVQHTCDPAIEVTIFNRGI